MNIAFYIDEMNYRGVANSTYQFALQNQKILRNKSIIFYNKKNYRNRKEAINNFKRKFITNGVKNFNDIENYKDKYNIDFLYTQKSGNKDHWFSKKIKTIVHAVYPQKLNQIHGYNYAYVSEWLSLNFSNNKTPFVPYITESTKVDSNLKKKLKIDRKKIIFGCYGGESSFDMKFVQKVVINIAKERKDIIFLFLNIDKFFNHPQIKFLKGTSNEKFKKQFINTCDAMIYGRSLGESFGLACAEFAVMNRDIISYKFNRHQSHKFNIPRKNFLEYDSYNSLYKIFYKYKKKKIKKYNCKYKNLTKERVMKIFKKVFLTKKNIIEIDFKDIISNYINFLKMNYLYIRHKIYNHYFNYFESKLLIK